MAAAAILKYRTEDSFYIYERPLTEVNVIASFSA